jgi:hypothetical protein
MRVLVRPQLPSVPTLSSASQVDSSHVQDNHEVQIVEPTGTPFSEWEFISPAANTEIPVDNLSILEESQKIALPDSFENDELSRKVAPPPAYLQQKRTRSTARGEVD